MVLVSSKTLIQVHAVLLLVIAGYLIKNPEMIVDSDMVFMMGEALKIVRALFPFELAIALTRNRISHLYQAPSNPPSLFARCCSSSNP